MEAAQLQRYLQMAIDWGVVFIPKIILALIIFWVGTKLISKINQIFENTLKNRNVDNTIRPFFQSLVDVALKLVLFLVIANIFGFETTSFVAIISAMAFAVGLALQGSLGHFASGILILILKPYKVGDEIKVGDATGKVEEIQIFNTILRTTGNRKVIIPNGNISSNNIINISGQGELCLELFYTIAETNDIDKVRATMLEVTQGCPFILSGKPMKVSVFELGPDEMKLLLNAWVDSQNHLEATFYLNEHIKKAFEKIGIEDHIEKIHVIMNK